MALKASKVNILMLLMPSKSEFLTALKASKFEAG